MDGSHLVAEASDLTTEVRKVPRDAPIGRM